MGLTPYETVSVVFAITMFVFAVVGWMFNRLLNQHKAFSAMKDAHQEQLDVQRDKIEDSKFERLIDRIDELVTQIKVLFTKHDDHASKIEGLRVNQGLLNKALGEQQIRCQEREKALTRQMSEFGFHRKNDIPILASRGDNPDDTGCAVNQETKP